MAEGIAMTRTITDEQVQPSLMSQTLYPKSEGKGFATRFWGC